MQPRGLPQQRHGMNPPRGGMSPTAGESYRGRPLVDLP
jgi:hypothetical protein